MRISYFGLPVHEIVTNLVTYISESLLIYLISHNCYMCSSAPLEPGPPYMLKLHLSVKEVIQLERKLIA